MVAVIFLRYHMINNKLSLKVICNVFKYSCAVLRPLYTTYRSNSRIKCVFLGRCRYYLQCGKLLLAKCECKMILASISIQVLAILASCHVFAKYNDLLLDSWCNKMNSPKSIECDLLACSDKIVPKHKFLFKLSLVFCCGHHHSFYGNTKNLHDCPDLGCYFLIVSD